MLSVPSTLPYSTVENLVTKSTFSKWFFRVSGSVRTKVIISYLFPTLFTLDSVCTSFLLKYEKLNL